MASKSKQDDTNLWIKFFRDAEIPQNIAVKYALTFAENRIKKGMLLDLNKEYLKEMGITVMGDIISILKHASKVYEEDARTNVLKKNSPTSLISASKKLIVSQKTKPTFHEEKDEDSSPPRTQALKTPVTSLSSKKFVRTSAVAKRVIAKSVAKAKPQQAIEEVHFEEPPKKKARRVLPEHEGQYKIIMPAGTTPRTQKILSGARSSLSGGKKNVFDRLGDNSVSSTTEMPVAKTQETTFTVTVTDNMLPGSASTDKITSVFSRLGNKQVGVASKSVTSQEEEKAANKLAYAGILKKQTTQKKKIIKIVKKKTPSMKADLPQTMMLQERLGMSALPTPPTVAKVLPIRKIAHDSDSLYSKTSYSVQSPSLSTITTGAKLRLGSSIVSTTKSTKQVVRINRTSTSSRVPSTTVTRTLKSGNVFTRLGKY